VRVEKWGAGIISLISAMEDIQVGRAIEVRGIPSLEEMSVILWD